MSIIQEQSSKDNRVLMELYTSLNSPVKKRIYSVDLQSWQGQEHDLAEDVIQDTVIRTFLQMQKVQRGEAPPVISLFHFSNKVATNRLYDLARKESRLIHPSSDITVQEELIADNWTDPTDEILDDIENASLFTLIAQIIVDFPIKQRSALLIDLAKLSPVDEPFSPLQQALKKVGVRLEEYRDLLPNSSVERGRHSALLSIAYKRVKKVVCAHLQLQDKDCSA